MLEVRDLNAGYGKVPVLRGVDFSVRPGEVVLVLGANGAGKTTLLKTVAGFLTVRSGSIVFDGTDITGRDPATNARNGLRLVLEEHRVFPDLTVEDNLRICRPGGLHGAAVRRRISEVTEPFPILVKKMRDRARSLSGGQQQMLALSQAMMGSPKVLMCDEPSRGLAQALMPAVLEFLKQRARDGTSVVIAEQMLDVAVSIADRAVVLDQGTVAFEGTAAEIAGDERVRKRYLGLD
jgi:branched-chain amino acid transport system ATP-binding protein